MHQLGRRVSGYGSMTGVKSLSTVPLGMECFSRRRSVASLTPFCIPLAGQYPISYHSCRVRVCLCFFYPGFDLSFSPLPLPKTDMCIYLLFFDMKAPMSVHKRIKAGLFKVLGGGAWFNKNHKSLKSPRRTLSVLV